MARSLRGIKRPHPLGSLPTRSGISLLTAESGIETSGLPGVKISGLPAAGAATETDQMEVNQGGISRRLTLDQALALVDVPAGDWDSITGKPSTFPPEAHTHPASEITDFAEAVDDRVGSLLVAGTNVTLTYNDVANSLTIDSTGGGGGGGAPSGPAGGDLAGTYPNPTVNPEVIDDRVAALLVAGANVTLSYNDAAGSLTIASTAAGGGGGTVTSTSVVNANGLNGSVATPTTTPAITLSTTVTGMVKGNGTALSAATAGTDYMTLANVSAGYQPLDTGLTVLSGIGTGMIANTATDAFAARTITGTASRVTVTNGNGVSGNPTLDISATYDALWQPVDADLTALAGLNATAGLVEQTGAAAFTKRALGVAASTSVPTRADADTRYLPAVSTTAPGSPVDNQLWFYSDAVVGGGQLYLRYNDGAGAAQWVPAAAAAGPAALMAPLDGYLYGLTLSNNSTTGINFAAGKCADSTNTTVITNTVSMNKLISATWAAGTGAGGLGNGVTRTASTWYHMFGGIITATGAFDAFYDTSVTGANKPAAFGAIRRLGSVLTSTGGTPPLIAFTQDGDNFWWAAELIDASAATTAGLCALTVPPGIRVRWQGNVYATGAGNFAMAVSTPGVTTVVATVVAGPPGASAASAISIITNTARQVSVDIQSTAPTYYLYTRGWIDTRGRTG